MRYIKNFAILLASVCLIGLPIDSTYAGGKGGGSSSGSHSSGSHSSPSHSSPSHSSGSGYSKPSSPSNSGSSTHSPSSSGTHSTTPTPSSNGYSKPATAPSTSPSTHSTTPSTTSTKPITPSTNDSHTVSKPVTPAPTSAPTSSLGAASNRKMSQDSYKAYQAERATATKPPQPVHTNDVKNNPARSTYQNTDQYMNKRTTIVNNYNNTHPGWGSMGVGMAPNYGMWSNSFLTGMIMGYVGTSLLSNSMWMYSHMHEPWYPSYRADLEAQAANNAELKAKLAAMDAEVAKFKAQNAQPQQQNTLPSGVDPALAIAPEVMMANDEHDGMSWWWAPVFVLLGVGAAWMFVKIIK